MCYYDEPSYGNIRIDRDLEIEADCPYDEEVVERMPCSFVPYRSAKIVLAPAAVIRFYERMQQNSGWEGKTLGDGAVRSYLIFSGVFRCKAEDAELSYSEFNALIKARALAVLEQACPH